MTPGGPWACLAAGPKRLPVALSIISFISSFSFSILYFFYNFLKKAPNQFKPISKKINTMF
jgi:hypothetical protein